MKSKGPKEYSIGIQAKKEFFRNFKNWIPWVSNYVRKNKRIEPVFFLNTSIYELYERVEFSPELFDALSSLGVSNMSELKECIYNKDTRLHLFDMDLRKEVNDLFFRASVPMKENW